MPYIICILLSLSSLLNAHFQVILPQNDSVTSTKAQTIKLMFMHPFEQTFMQMEKPHSFGFFLDGKKNDLTTKLVEEKADGMMTWSYHQKFKEMGNYIFYVDPKPYFEASEGKFIRHLTKTIIDVHNAGVGWDKPIGLKAEIIPLSRPYSLYKGNLFSATVLFKNKPVPYATIEVEYFNTQKKQAPSDAHITQIIKADTNGVFHYALPKSGWWGFAALMQDDITITKDSKEFPVELGAVIWLKAYEMK